MVIDDKDKKIIEVLKENSRTSIQEISQKTLIPITTVHNRIKRLETSSIIKQYTAIINEDITGKRIEAYLLVNANCILPNMTKISQDDIAKRIKAIKGITEVSSIIGSADLLAKANCTSIDEFNENVLHAIKEMGGVEKVQTLLVVQCY